MCRLYAIRSNEPTKVECTLVHSQNALLLQSREDLAGREHSDGWGIAYYLDDMPVIEKQASAAFTDLSFSLAAERVYSETVIAHVRLATVGELKPDNAHPFAYEVWAFAHNGTVQGFETLRPELISETRTDLNANRRGETDSEHLFYWLLSRLAESGVVLKSGVNDLNAAGNVVADSIAELAERCHRAAPDKEPKLNIVLTDGHAMIATRWNNSLFRLDRGGLHDCDICGIPHVHHKHNTNYRAVVVASEPLSEEHWLEVPNHSLLKIDHDARSELIPIATASVTAN